MRRTTAYAVLGLLACAAPAAAQTETGTGGTGFAPEATAPAPDTLAAPPAADLYGRPAPRVSRVVCRTSCTSATTARPGSLVRVYGTQLRRIGEVIFFGVEADEADDVSVAPHSVSSRSVLVRVPRSAATGRIALARVDGTRSPASAATLTVAPPDSALPAGVIEAEVTTRKVFYGARRPAQLSYVVGGTRPASVRVELVRARTGVAVESWTPGEVPAGEPQVVEWDGTVDGRPQPDGVYQFRVVATGADGLRATSAQADTPIDPEAPAAFRLLGYRFPIVGAHDYGEFAASFGGGRGHQGQDVFAACGTPLVAARGGVVKYKQFQSRAGHYVVIDGARTGTDYAYMHLRDAALVDRGDRVATGQLIGYVGDTGRASGCHLHFEQWAAPGWYSGGSPFDPLPDLQAWDAQS